MKRYYSVKEASKLLGVSTNTIYKYLKEGKIESKRIGKGRIKIPSNNLLPYIDPEQITDNQLKEKVQEKLEVEKESVEEVVESQKVVPTPNIKESTPEVQVSSNPAEDITPEMSDNKAQNQIPSDISQDRGDIIFFRIFKAVVFLGLGFIYFLSAGSLFTFSGGFLQEISLLLLTLLPFALIGVGLFNFAEVVRPKRFNKFHLFADAFSLLILGYYSFIAYFSTEYGLFAFTLSFAAIAIGHLIQGANGSTGASFYQSFTRFSLFLAIIGGIVVLLYPEIVPVEFIAGFILEHKGIAGFIWFVAVFAPLVYLLTPSGKKTFLKWPFFVMISAVFLIIATELTLIAKWDISYISFLTGVFGLFLVWWTQTETRVDSRRIFLTSLSFFWIASTLLFGLLALRASREDIKADAQAKLQEVLDTLVLRVNRNFDERSAILTGFAGSPETKQLVKEKNEEKASLIAKQMYEKLENAERVVIYDREGIAIGVYPRNTLTQGTNFSSRSYFQETLRTYKSYISPVFENILGTATIIHSEPLFEENEFIGMVGVTLDLNKLALYYQVDGAIDYNLTAVDENGIIVFDSDFSRIGFSDNKTIFTSIRPVSSQNEEIVLNQPALTPRWTVRLQAPVAPLVARLSSMHIILSILLVVNSLFSIAASIAASGRKKEEVQPKTVPASVFTSPRFV